MTKDEAWNKFADAVKGLNDAKQIHWYGNPFGDQCADLSLQLIRDRSANPETLVLRACGGARDQDKNLSVFQWTGDTAKSVLDSAPKSVDSKIFAYLSIGGFGRRF